MADPKTPSCDVQDKTFSKQGGVTNGAAWYSVEGGLPLFRLYYFLCISEDQGTFFIRRTAGLFLAGI